jgi:hypothetical protein
MRECMSPIGDTKPGRQTRRDDRETRAGFLAKRSLAERFTDRVASFADICGHSVITSNRQILWRLPNYDVIGQVKDSLAAIFRRGPIDIDRISNEP